MLEKGKNPDEDGRQNRRRVGLSGLTAVFREGKGIQLYKRDSNFIVPSANLFSDNDGVSLGKPHIEVPLVVGKDVTTILREIPVSKDPRQIDIPLEHTIPVPQAILDQTAALKQADKKNIYIRNVDITIADTKTPQKEKSNPYEVDASDEYLYVKSRTIKDPKYPDIPFQLFRLGHENGKITSIIPDADESMFRVAMADFPEDTIVGRVRDALGIAEPSEQDRAEYEKLVKEQERLAEKVKKKNEGTVTNESLEAVSIGLIPDNTDRILSICGAGDVPFALALEGAQVDAIDMDPKMVEDAKTQAELIRDGEYELFLSRNDYSCPTETQERNDFFSKGIIYKGFRAPSPLGNISSKVQRLGFTAQEIWGDKANLDFSESNIQTLRENIDNITFSQGDILTTLRSGKYTKVYLSNVIGFKGQNYEFAVEVFKALADNLPSGGLVYSTVGNITSEYLERAYTEGLIEPDAFVLDDYRTRIAAGAQKSVLRRIENADGVAYGWNPRVYKKR